MAFSKIVLNGTVLMDVTDDTVNQSNLLLNQQATKNDGNKVQGTFDAINGSFTIDATAVATYNSAKEAIEFN